MVMDPGVAKKSTAIAPIMLLASGTLSGNPIYSTLTVCYLWLTLWHKRWMCWALLTLASASVRRLQLVLRRSHTWLSHTRYRSTCAFDRAIQCTEVSFRVYIYGKTTSDAPVNAADYHVSASNGDGVLHEHTMNVTL